MGRRNKYRKPITRSPILKGLPRPGVQPNGDGVQVGLGGDGKLRLLREVLVVQEWTLLDLPVSKSDRLTPEKAWCDTIHDLHKRLIGGR